MRTVSRGAWVVTHHVADVAWIFYALNRLTWNTLPEASSALYRMCVQHHFLKFVYFPLRVPVVTIYTDKTMNRLIRSMKASTRKKARASAVRAPHNESLAECEFCHTETSIPVCLLRLL